MGRPRRYPDCPRCGWGPLRILQTKRRGFCTVRYAVCDSCGARFKLVSAGEGDAVRILQKADR